jgi:uncharacterized protein YjeT (DUF2065 family)
MWHEFGIALCLLLVLEGILPFLYPAGWRRLMASLAGVDDHGLRLAGLASMVTGTVLLYLIN